MVSLLITILTQMMSSLLGLRGKNLADALEAMILKLDPQVNQQAAGLAHKLADQVLTHPVISDSILSMKGRWPMLWKRATAIRPQELLGILRHLAGDTSAPDAPPQTTAEAAARFLKVLDTPTPAAAEALAALKNKLPDLALQQGRAVVEHFTTATNVALGNLEKWFNSAQDRARQWFGMHTRIISVSAALLVAFVLQLDAFQLIQRLSSDPEARAKLVANAAPMTQQAQKLLDEANPASVEVYTEVLPQLQAKYPGLPPSLNSPPTVTSVGDLAVWFKIQLANTTFSNQTAVIAADYQHFAQAATRRRLDDWSQEFGDLESRFSKSGIALIPSPYPGLCSGAWSWPWQHLLGIFASAALLSLGAPFWFNLLKSLANLRPALAQQVEKNPKSDPNQQ